MFHSILIVANIFSSINPSLFALPLLNIVYPLSFVSASIHMSVNSKSTCLVCFEFTNINVSFSMPKCSFSLSFIFYPVALINSTVCPYLNSISTSFFYSSLLIDHHLSFVHASVGEHIIWYKNQARNIFS